MNNKPIITCINKSVEKVTNATIAKSFNTILTNRASCSKSYSPSGQVTLETYSM